MTSRLGMAGSGSFIPYEASHVVVMLSCVMQPLHSSAQFHTSCVPYHSFQRIQLIDISPSD